MMDPRARHGLVVLLASVVALASWGWGYRPAVRAYRRDQQDVVRLTERLAHVEAMVQASGGAALWQVRMSQRLAAIKGRFPSPEQLPQLLNALVDTIKAGDLKLVNVSQGNLEPVQDEGQPVLLEDLPCYRLPVTITAESRYHALVHVLEQVMSEAFPSVVSLEDADLRLTDPLSARLGATLTLHLYVVGTPHA